MESKKATAADKPQTEGIIFLDSLHDSNIMKIADPVLHLLCTKGSMSFVFQEVNYNIQQGDYVILPNALLASKFHEGLGFSAIIMVLSESYVAQMALLSNYGVIGHLSLLRNPVMRLTEPEQEVCLEDLQLIRRRMGNTQHRFRQEMTAHLLLAHILDLYDIHARHYQLNNEVSEQSNRIVTKFISLLYQGENRAHHDVSYYASQLCVTPSYLSELCRKVSGEPATYWIDRFLMSEIVRLLHVHGLTLSDIADKLHFSSLAYFSRYVRLRTGLSPSALRKFNDTHVQSAPSAR